MNVVKVVEANPNIFVSHKEAADEGDLNELRDRLKVLPGYDFPESAFSKIQGDRIHLMDNGINIDVQVESSSFLPRNRGVAADPMCNWDDGTKPCDNVQPTRYNGLFHPNLVNNVDNVGEVILDTAFNDIDHIKKFIVKGKQTDPSIVLGTLAEYHQIGESDIYVNVPENAIDQSQFVIDIGSEEGGGGNRILADGDNPKGSIPFGNTQSMGPFSLSGGSNNDGFDFVSSFLRGSGNDPTTLHDNDNHRELDFAPACTQCYEVRVGVLTDTTFCQKYGNDNCAETYDWIVSFLDDVSEFYEVNTICSRFVLSFHDCVSIGCLIASMFFTGERIQYIYIYIYIYVAYASLLPLLPTSM